MLCPTRVVVCFRRYALVGLAFSSGFLARAAQPITRNVVDDWQALQTLIAPVTPVAKGKRTPAQIAADREQKADRLLQAAEAAKAFYTSHPSDAKAGKARKLEVATSLESVRLGKAAIEASALELAKAYRADKSQLREDRFEIALAADRLEVEKRRRGKQKQDAPNDVEAMADALRNEFGPIPEIHGLYIGLVDEVDMHTANRLATKLLEMRPPPRIKATAQAITARYGLIGDPLRLRLTRTDSTTFELPTLPAPAGPTVLYLWSAVGGADSNPFAALSSLKGKVSKEVRWIYLGLPATRAQAASTQAKAPFAGSHCSDEGGPLSPIAQRLKVRATPMVFVLNRQGVLTGFGRVDELPALLAAANR